MVMVDYDIDQGWHNAQVKPYGPIALDPSAMVLHYGQEIFEGLKASPAAGRLDLGLPARGQRCAPAAVGAAAGDAGAAVDDFIASLRRCSKPTMRGARGRR